MVYSIKYLLYKVFPELARPVQCYWHLRKQVVKHPIEPKRNFIMTNSNIQNQVAAAFAAIFAAAVFVSASVGPAVNNAAALIA